MTITVALVDDQPLVRMGLRVLVESEDDLVLVGRDSRLGGEVAAGARLEAGSAL